MAGLLARIKAPVGGYFHSANEPAVETKTQFESAPPGVQLLAETYLRIFGIVRNTPERSILKNPE